MVGGGAQPLVPGIWCRKSREHTRATQLRRQAFLRWRQGLYPHRLCQLTLWAGVYGQLCLLWGGARRYSPRRALGDCRHSRLLRRIESKPAAWRVGARTVPTVGHEQLRSGPGVAG